jgi:hypothetical protein
MNFLGLSFVYPALLGSILLAPVIILAYLNRSPRKEKIVSSLILLRLLPKAPAIRQKIKIPPLFWLELLILVLLGFLAAYPNYSSKGDRVGIILDSSLSMRSRENATTRFEVAQNEIKKWLDLQNQNDQFTLYTSSPRLRRVSGKLVSQGEIKSTLASARISSSPDYLDESLSQLVSSASFDKIFVVSDKEPSYSKSGNTFPVDARMVGELVSNAALSNLRLDKKNSAVIAAIGYYSQKPGRAKVQAYLESNLIAETPVVLEPRRVIEARLNLPRSLSGLVRVEVVLSEPDSIYVDNTGYLLVGTTQSKNILLVTTNDSTGNSLGLDKLSAEAISPQSYTMLTDELKKEFRLIIFHAVCPGTQPGVPSLIISPPLDCNLFPGQKEVSNPVFSSWKTENAITSYLNFNLIRPNRSVVFQPSNWAETVISVEQGPALLAGEKDGIRYAVSGFELLPFEGKSTPAVSILTLNLFSWLSSGGEFQDTMRTGAQIQVPQDRAGELDKSWWQLTLPAGEIVRSDTWKDNDGPPRADASGLYELKSGVGDKKFVVNAFHPEESATNERGSYEASYVVPQSDETPRQSSLWSSILVLILSLLAIETAIRLYFSLKSRSSANNKRSSESSSLSQVRNA